ncbi:MAG: transcriptional regulator [Frankiales bacterium]|nr:transcriptional regulator [Frankiales bacterium]
MRRTQAERRAATVTALLDATLEELAEVGYASLTTGSVVARAGVTRGAQAHYFATKAELVVAALKHLTDRLTLELQSAGRQVVGERAQYELILNRLFEVNSGPASTALLELFVASRTDPELAEHLHQFDKDVSDSLQETALSLGPDFVKRDDAIALLVTAIATIRGLWLLRAVTSERQIRRQWPRSRDQLIAGAGF